MNKEKKRQVSVLERLISFFILIVLFMIFLVILRLQSEFSLADLGMVSNLTNSSIIGTETPLDVGLSLPKIYQFLGKSEFYNAETLYEKINGKAPLYLDAEFDSLHTYRFSNSEYAEMWGEVYVYDMRRMENAFSVFSAQRRPSGVNLEFTKNSYRTSNAVFFAKGQFYVEIIGSSDNADLLSTIIDMADKLQSQIQISEKQFNFAGIFELEGLVDDSLNLFKTNAFGFDYLENVYVAKYEVAGNEFTVFVIELLDDKASKKLAGKYATDLIDFGYERVLYEYLSLPCDVVCVMDTCELVLAKGRFVIGVHETSLVEEAAKILEQVLHNIENIEQ